MNRIAGWFGRQADRERRAVFLEDALLGNRFRGYMLYRLRFFYARYLASACVHGIRYLFLYAIFSEKVFVGLVLVHAGVGLSSSFWWGGLEVMRRRIRELKRSARPHRIPSEIGRWLSVSLFLSAATLVAGAGWLGWRLGYRGLALDPATLYASSLVLRLAIDFVTRVFHSGIYAIRRIYRPLPAVVAVELSGFLAVLMLWPWIGVWSFPVAMILATLVSSALVTFYTLRVYRFFRFLPLPLFEGPLGRSLELQSRKELLAAGASYSLMKLDALLVLVLFAWGSSSADPAPLFLLFFVLGPTIQAGFDWAQLFYFDLKRLEIRPFANLRRRFEQGVHRTAWAQGIVFWALACLTGTLFLRKNLGAVYVALLPFFLSRSLLAFAQMRSYAARRYRELLWSAVACLCGLALACGLVSRPSWRLAILTAVMLAVFGVLAHRARGVDASAEDVRLPGITEWLDRVRRRRAPTRIRCLEFDARTRWTDAFRGIAEWDARNRWNHRRAAEAVARKLGDDSAVTIVFPGRVVWFERSNGTPGIRREWLLGLAGGAVRRIASTKVEADGACALGAARRRELLGGILDAAVESVPGRSLEREELRREFLRRFPDGMVYDPDRAVPQALERLPSTDKREILRDATRFARDFRPSAKTARFDVTAVSRQGELAMIFVATRTRGRKALARWRTAIQGVNLHAALGTGKPWGGST